MSKSDTFMQNLMKLCRMIIIPFLTGDVKRKSVFSGEWIDRGRERGKLTGDEGVMKFSATAKIKDPHSKHGVRWGRGREEREFKRGNP